MIEKEYGLTMFVFCLYCNITYSTTGVAHIAGVNSNGRLDRFGKQGWLPIYYWKNIHIVTRTNVLTVSGILRHHNFSVSWTENITVLW